ncbi:MAG: methionyl-tRNA formyltransferase [SAR202 cluster bacterium]|nr:methionyl-tRNA formyltransferase [SAR202 cluster bacterium]|tara:strand:+ start:8941 stop:9864 length:924 start_codon:yes stop_codon:yes gene_type:complete
MREKMKIIFFGSPPSCINILNSLIENHNIISIVSKKQPEATKRRKIMQSEVSLFASNNNIPFLDPDILDSKFKDKLKKMKPDLFLVCAYGKILSDDFIKIPTYGTLNIHPSLLPQYRGPSPVQNTIINLDDKSGYTIIKMDKGVDTGDILFISEPISLRKNEKYLDLLNFLLSESSKGITQAIDNLVNNKNIDKQDNEKASYTELIKKTDGLIEWNSSAEKIEAKFRAFSSWPQSYSFHNNKRFKILDMELTNFSSEQTGKITKFENNILIDTKTNKLKIIKIQFDGKKPIDALAYFGNFDLLKTKL